MNRTHELLVQIRRHAYIITSAVAAAPLCDAKVINRNIDRSAGKILQLVEALARLHPDTAPPNEAAELMAGVYRQINSPAPTPKKAIPIELLKPPTLGDDYEDEEEE